MAVLVTVSGSQSEAIPQLLSPFPTPHIWQCLGTFLVVMPERAAASSREWPEGLLNVIQSMG